MEEALRLFEAAHGVHVLIAAEGGSRMLGWGSTDSDFDIRLVYVKRMKDYLTIERSAASAIEFECLANTHDNTSKIEVTMQGWDLPRYLDLIQQSNPNAIDCLFSPVHWRPTANNTETYGNRHGMLLKDALIPLVKKHISYDKHIHGRLAVVKSKSPKELRGRIAARWKRKRDTSPAKDDDIVHNEETVCPKTYIILLRCIADASNLLRTVMTEEAVHFPPPLRFQDGWQLYLEHGGVDVPEALQDWVQTYLNMKHTSSKQSQDCKSQNRSLLLEDFVFEQYNTLLQATVDNVEVLKNKHIPVDTLNTLFRSLIDKEE